MEQESNKAAYERVSTVIPLKGFHLLLTFMNMELRIYNCQGLFNSGTPSIDEIIFSSVHADSDGVSWDNGIHVQADVLYNDSIPLVDFLDDLLGGKTDRYKQHDPYFIHDDDRSNENLLRTIVGMVGRKHYEEGQKDKEAAIALTIIQLMEYAGSDNVSIINWLRIILGISLGDAAEYFINRPL